MSKTQQWQKTMESWSGTLTCTHLFWNGQRPKREAIAANTGGKIKITRDNIHDKAQIAAYHYVTRFTAFMENAIMPKSRVVDYFNPHSSPHRHGFVRIEGQPELDLNNTALLAQQWGIHVSANNLEVFRWAPPDEQPPMLLRHEQQGLDFSNLAQLLQRAQLQKCSDTYCICENKETGIIKDQPVVIKNPQRSAAHLMFYPECNDPNLNRYNITMSLGWLANTDITPRTSLQALLNCLSEYCTKTGVKIAHVLFPPPLVNLSCLVIPVDCKFALKQNQSSSVGGRECVAGRNVIQEYMERDHVYHDVSYHQVLTQLDTRDKKIRPIARAQTEDRVLRYFSIYPSNP
ncbi:hypothetical protein D6C90_10123 [Aureobasidium pullulans]|uniref:Uncharacterized protein n=1 Tax=Aureobasidium pullulans TaxID=5580 RepID=A0A4S9STD3_AURPU|nr:hypothetical protein D6C90_10123 [Aureobasidium pullulans]